MKIKLLLIFTVSGMLFFTEIKSQGCSDAGFCTIGNMKQHLDGEQSEKKQKITVLLANGIGDENVYVFTPAIQYDNTLNKYWSIQARVTANYASGNLGNATGLGDLFLSGSYTFKKTGKWQTALLLGTKIFLNSSNILIGGKPLPMPYQSSLGTVDLLTGISVTNDTWFFSTALQQPLTGINGNTFLPEYWETPEATKYFPTNDFNRKGDVLLKAGYTLLSGNRFKLNIGMLGIYHLGNDTYINGNVSNQPIVLVGSQGLTLNGIAAALYRVNNKFSIGLAGGVPFVVRDIRPDGLTRKFVLSPEFIFNF